MDGVDGELLLTTGGGEGKGGGGGESSPFETGEVGGVNEDGEAGV